MNRHRHVLTRLVAALAGVLPCLVIGAAGESSAAPALVPPTAVYAVGGPDTPLAMTYVTSSAAASVVVTADGFVSAIECPASFAVTVAAGAGTITAAGGGSIASGTDVACTVSLAFGDAEPASVSVVVSERDAFNAELANQSQVVTLEQIDVTASLGAVVLTGDTYQPAEPRSIGDELTRSVTFDLVAARSLSFSVPSATTLTGCAPQTAASVTCTMTRTLTLADLAAGTAPVTPTLFVDGFPVSRPAADIAVPSERRLTVDAVASAAVVRVGETVTIESVVTNEGSIELTGLAVGGAGITTATCDGQLPSSLTLAPGSSVTCTATHVATHADIGAVTPVVARAVAPFGSDSDLVDDDPTSATDVDAVSFAAPYSVSAAAINASLSLGSAVAFVDDAGVERMPMTLNVSSVGALSNALVTVPVQPFPGVTVDDCDSIVGDECLVSIGDITAGQLVERTLTVVIDPAGLTSTGVDGSEIAGALSADGDVAVDVSAAVVRTAGLLGAIVPTVVEATGTSATFEIDVEVAAGHPVTVTIAPAAGRPATVTSCENGAGLAVPVSASADGALLGVLAGGTMLTCTLTQNVIDSDRTSGAMPVEVTVVGLAGTAEVRRVLRSDLPTIALVVVPGPAPTPPTHGYSVAGSPDRPNTVTYTFELLAYGDLTAGGTVPLERSFGGTDAFECGSATGTSPARFACTGTHAITVADLAAGSYGASIEATLGASATARASLSIATPHEAVELLVTELSTPRSSAGYAAGETLRLLIQIRNRGSLPLTIQSLVSDLPAADASPSATATATATATAIRAVVGCAAGSSIAPGQTLDCDVTAVVPSGLTRTSLTFDVVTAEGVVASFAVAVQIDGGAAAPLPAPPGEPSPTLPRTGSGPYTQLALMLAIAGCGVGLVLRRAARRTA